MVFPHHFRQELFQQQERSHQVGPHCEVHIRVAPFHDREPPSQPGVVDKGRERANLGSDSSANLFDGFGRTEIALVEVHVRVQWLLERERAVVDDDDFGPRVAGDELQDDAGADTAASARDHD